MNEDLPIRTPKVTLVTHTRDPLETVFAVWEASKGEAPLMSTDWIKGNVPAEEVEKLFMAVIAQRIPIGEHIDFVFMLENISISWREQAVRHRIGTSASPERLGMDIIPDLQDSSFWSQCFVGATRIRLLDGTFPTLAELAERGGEFWVYSCDDQGLVVPGRGHSARRTKRSKVLEIELDNGRKERCTPDHLWMIRDGKYAEAQTLKAGDSLMPLYSKLDKYGYELVFEPGAGRWAYTHQRVDCELNGLIPKGTVVHHASFNKLNNDPSKLERMGKLDHIALHAAIVVERMRSDPEGHALALSKAQKRLWDSMTEVQREEWRERAASARGRIDQGVRDESARALMKQRWQDADWRDKMLPVLARNGANTAGRNDTVEQRQRKSVAAKKRVARDGLPAGVNHKVVSVRWLDVEEDVYDITVDKHHNFALASGVFVHNSMRIQDMGRFADERAYRIPETLLAHPDKNLQRMFEQQMRDIQYVYNALVKSGVPMEDARELMPLGAQHRMSWRLNIGSLQHIFGKRGCWILQLGIWGPIITGMVEELATKVHPIFRELISPPCMKGDKYNGCVFQEESRRRYTQDDKLPPCSLHMRQEWLLAQVGRAGKGRIVVGSNSDACSSAALDSLAQDLDALETLGVPRAAEMLKRAEDYRAFWNRDPFSGKRLPYKLPVVK